jgi:carbon monoxide dehydrogenase subunit G
MKISGENTIPHPAQEVWDALLDPAVLVRTIPGCERLETTGENTYAMTVTRRSVEPTTAPARCRTSSRTSRW